MYIIGFYKSTDTIPYAVSACDEFRVDEKYGIVHVRMGDHKVVETEYDYFCAVNTDEDPEALARLSALL